MRKLADGEMLALSKLLKMETDGLIVSRTMSEIVTDEDLKKQTDASILAAEGRIKGLQQFIEENDLRGI